MKYDYNRNIIAWVIFTITAAGLYLAKPKIQINPTIMMLPQTKALAAIDKSKVSIYSEISPFWAKTLLARISVKYPIGTNANETETEEQAFALIKENAAKIGANAIVIDRMGETKWFYTGKDILQIYAFAYKI